MGKDMHKGLIIKKCKNHRYAIRFFSVLFVSFMIILCVQDILFALVGCIPFLIIIPFTLYYETWWIKLTEKEIETSSLFKKSTYTYSQIQQVIKRYYSSEKDTVIRIEFSDGTAIHFRNKDMNFQKAEKELQRHCSIKTV